MGVPIPSSTSQTIYVHARAAPVRATAVFRTAHARKAVKEFFQRTALSGFALFLSICLVLGQLIFSSWPSWLAAGEMFYVGRGQLFSVKVPSLCASLVEYRNAEFSPSAADRCKSCYPPNIRRGHHPFVRGTENETFLAGIWIFGQDASDNLRTRSKCTLTRHLSM